MDRVADAAGTARDRWALAAIAAAVVSGCLLRSAMAQGDLWLDEAWSLDLVRPLLSALGVFTQVSHDNNHYLNSLWLFSIGPDRAPWTYRVPSVLLGTLSIALAAANVWHRSRMGAVLAALLAAASLPFVIYGSEARGYAGMMAATLLALWAFGNAAESPEGSRSARRNAWILGLAIGVGTLFHFTMLATLAVLGLSALLHFLANRPPKAALDATLRLFRPALLLLLPAMAAFLAGLAHRGEFMIGNSVPGRAETFFLGYGSQLRFMLGLPQRLPLTAAFLCAGPLLLAGLRLPGMTALRRDTIFAAVVVLPAGMLLVHLPNLEMARYYLVPGIVTLLTLAELAGTWLERGRPALRVLAILLVGLSLLGQAAADISAMELGRGRYGEALASMADPSGHVLYATHDPFWIDSVARLAAERRGLVVERVADSAFCRRPPAWFIDVLEDPEGLAPARLTAGPAACSLHFVAFETVRANPLSGMRWNIYRRSE